MMTRLFRCTLIGGVIAILIAQSVEDRVLEFIGDLAGAVGQ